MLDPRLLRTYLAVCREGSISGAARRLNISQPSVSVAIGLLEGKLATTLFERCRQGIVLTAAGHALARRAEAMEALLRDAAEEVAHAAAGVLGPLRIAGTPGALVSLVPQAIAHQALETTRQVAEIARGRAPAGAVNPEHAHRLRRLGGD